MLFDNESEILHDRVKLGDIPKMTDKDYTVRGCTALIDAIGGAIHHVGNIHKYARPEDVPEHTIFVITTDGQENASHRYTSEQDKAVSRTRHFTPHGNAGRRFYAEIRGFLRFCENAARVSRMPKKTACGSQTRKSLGKSGFFRVSDRRTTKTERLKL